MISYTNTSRPFLTALLFPLPLSLDRCLWGRAVWYCCTIWREHTYFWWLREKLLFSSWKNRIFHYNFKSSSSRQSQQSNNFVQWFSNCAAKTKWILEMVNVNCPCLILVWCMGSLSYILWSWAKRFSNRFSKYFWKIQCIYITFSKSIWKNHLWGVNYKLHFYFFPRCFLSCSICMCKIYNVMKWTCLKYYLLHIPDFWAAVAFT